MKNETRRLVGIALTVGLGAVVYLGQGQGSDGADAIEWASGLGGDEATADPTGKAANALDELVVKGSAPMTGYDREVTFGPAWSDDVSVPGGHDGCDTRNGVMRETLTHVVIEPGTNGCVVASGVLEEDPYSGKTIRYDDGGEELHLEHIVALGDAYRTGAQQLSAQERQNLANDPLNLTPVDASLNMSKGDANIATWQPPNNSYRCDYAARQIAVKTKYDLWIVPAEKQTMTTILSHCPGQTLPTAQEQK